MKLMTVNLYPIIQILARVLGTEEESVYLAVGLFISELVNSPTNTPTEFSNAIDEALYKAIVCLVEDPIDTYVQLLVVKTEAYFKSLAYDLLSNKNIDTYYFKGNQLILEIRE